MKTGLLEGSFFSYLWKFGLDNIEYTLYVSQWLPDNGTVYVWEEYLNKFLILSRHVISDEHIAAAISKYLDTPEIVRPKYKTLQEKLLAEHRLFWENEFESQIIARYNYPFLFGRTYWNRAKQPDESSTVQDTPVPDSEREGTD